MKSDGIGQMDLSRGVIASPSCVSLANASQTGDPMQFDNLEWKSDNI
jgi:hypothetical protein